MSSKGYMSKLELSIQSSKFRLEVQAFYHLNNAMSFISLIKLVINEASHKISGI